MSKTAKNTENVGTDGVTIMQLIELSHRQSFDFLLLCALITDYLLPLPKLYSNKNLSVDIVSFMFHTRYVRMKLLKRNQKRSICCKFKEQFEHLDKFNGIHVETKANLFYCL